MLDFLYHFPEGVILVLTVVVIVALISILPLIVQRFPPLYPNEKNTDFVIRTQATLFTMTSLVLAFTLVQTDINFRQADALVSSEAARIEQLDRLLTRYGDAEVAAGRPLLRAYALALARDEWPNMLDDERHESSMRTFGALSRHILAINPTTERQNLVLAEMFRTLDTISDVRAQRLNIVSTKLPSLYWWVVLLAMAMLLFVSATIQQTAFRRIVLSAQAAVLGGFLGFVFIMDQPFRGETGLGPEAILKAVERIDARNN